MPKNTSERIIDRPLQGRQTARVWSGSSSTSNTDTNTTADALLAIDFITLNANATLTNERYLDVSSPLTKTDGGAGAALTIGMATPPTLSVSSTNNASTGSHAIASSSSPGAAAWLLASSGAGNLTLPTFTASTKLTTPLIDTASGNLQLTPAADVYITKNVGIGVATVETPLHVESTSTGVTNFLLLEGNRNTSDTEVGILFKDRSAVTGGQQVARIYAERIGSTGDFDLVFHGGKQANTGLSDELLRMKGGSSRVGILQSSPSYTLDVTGDAQITTSLTTPLLTTATNVDLVINPAGTGAVQFPNDQTLRTTSFDSSFPINGWQINEVAGVSGYSALTIGKIQADELAVRVFVADEVRVDRGDEYWTKSYGIVAETFTTPSSIGGTVSVAFEDSPALVGAIFTSNDWVLIRKLDIDTGITLSNIWGQMATYVNNSDGTQNWTFTLRSGPTSESVTKGSLAIDFGASGAALIHLSVIDAAGAPYIKMRKWAGANPYTPSNFTTYLQIGYLGSTGNAYVTPAGYGLYARSTNDESRFILADDNGLQLRGAAFKMYNSTLQTVDISATDGSVKLGTDISSGATTSFDFDGATGDLSITGDLHTADVYLTQAEGILLNTGTTDDYVSGYNTKSIQWFSDIDSPTGNALVTLAGAKATNDVYANLSAYSASGIAKVRLIADSDVSSTTDSQMYLRSQTGGNSIIYMFSDTISLQGVNGVTSSALSVSGDIAVSGNVDGVDIAAFKSAYDSHNHSGTYLPLSGGTLTGTLTSRAIVPSADNTYDLGASGTKWQDIYAVNLHADNIIGVPSFSHSHDASDITSGTLDFARIPTTWTGALTIDADSAGTSNYIRWLTQTSTSKAWDLVARAHDYATTAQQNDLLLTFYDGSTIYTALHADSATRVIDFGQTPTVSGTAVVLTSRTVTAGSGMTGGGALSADITISHADTSTAVSADNSGMTFIQDVTLDTYGHVTGLTSTDVSTVLTGYLKSDGTVTGATSQAQVFTTGVGIGVASPEALLHIESTSAAVTNFLQLEGNRNTSDTEVGILFKDRSAVTGGQQVARIYADRVGSTGDFDLVFHGGNQTNAGLSSELVRMKGGSSRVGILQASPSYTLDVNGTVRVAGIMYANNDIEMTGELLAANGSVSAPSIAGLSDTDTGLYWSAADVLSVTTGGGLRASFNSAGATVVGAVTVPTINTASGTLTIAPANSTTAITGALSLTGALSGTSWIILSNGVASMVAATASSSIQTPVVGTASGNLSLSPAGGTVSVLGALAGNSTATFTTSVSAPTVTTASGNLTLTSAGGTVAVTGALTGSSTATFVTSVSTPTLTNAGALTLSPTGNITLTPGGNVTLVNTATMGSDNYASRTTGWRIDGAGGGDFRYIFTDELHAKSFIADLEQALAGSQIISKSVAVLASDFVAPYAGGAQQLVVEDLPSAADMAAFQANDIVLLRSFNRAGGSLTIGNCWGAVTSYTDGTGTQTWTFTRSGTTTYNTITARGTATSSTSSAATSRSVTKPTGVVSGDVLIAVVTYDGAVDVVTASGWTELASAAGTDINAHILYKVAGGSEGASYTFSVVNSHAIGAAITAYYNVDTTTPIDDYSIQANAAGASMPAPAAWAASTVGRLVFLGGVSNSTTVTPPSGATELVDAGSTGIRVYVADEVLTTSGDHTKTATIASSSYASVASIVILRPTYVSMTSAAGAMTPGTTVSAKSLVLDYGVSGNGFVETTAVDGAYGANSPYQQVVTWTTHPATGQAVRTRTGNLYGLFAQANEYGFYAGSGVTTADNYIRLSSYTSAFNNVPIQMYSGGSKFVDLNVTRGLDIEIDTADGDSNRAVSFRSSGTTYDWTKAYNTGGWHYLKMASEPIAGLNNSIVLRTSAASTKESSIYLSTTNAAGSDTSNYVYLHHKTDGTGELELSSDATTVFGPVTLSNAVGTQLTVEGSSVFNGNIGTAWTALSYASGWANYGGVFQPGQYKKVGDLIFLRGLVARSSGASAVIATLPAGYRPTAQSVFGVYTNAGGGGDRVDVRADGAVELVVGGTTYVQLDGIVFSTI